MSADERPAEPLADHEAATIRLPDLDEVGPALLEVLDEDEAMSAFQVLVARGFRIVTATDLTALLAAARTAEERAVWAEAQYAMAIQRAEMADHDVTRWVERAETLDRERNAAVERAERLASLLADSATGVPASTAEGEPEPDFHVGSGAPANDLWQKIQDQRAANAKLQRKYDTLKGSHRVIAAEAVRLREALQAIRPYVDGEVQREIDSALSAEQPEPEDLGGVRDARSGGGTA